MHVSTEAEWFVGTATDDIDAPTFDKAESIAKGIARSGGHASIYRRTDPVRHEIPEDGICFVTYADWELVVDGVTA